MYLNLSIIQEELDHIIDSSHIDDKLDLNIKQVQLFSSKMTELQKEYLYLLNEEILPHFLSMKVNCPFAVIGSCNINLLHLKNEWIQFQESIDISYVHNQLISVFEKYEGWRKNIYQSLIKRQTFTELLQVCAAPFYNPIALHDVRSILIAYAGSFPEHYDKVWDMVLQLGYFPLENYITSTDFSFWQSERPFLQRIPELQLTILGSCLRYQSKIVGFLCSTDINGAFTTGQMSIFYILQIILEEFFAPSFLLSDTNYKTHFIIERLLRGDILEESAIFYFLRNWGCKETDTFQVGFFYPKEHTKLTKKTQNELLYTLQRIIPSSILHPFEDGIVIISKQKLSEREKSMILPLLIKYDMQCAMSNTFSHFSYLYYAYLQCRAVMQTGEPNKNENIQYFKSCYEDFFLKSLSNATSLKVLCNSKILELSRDDRGLEFIRSLRTYIINGRSITAAARKLYLHRNTLIYRIEKLEQILGIKFKEAGDTELFYFYISCLIAENLPESE